VSSARSGARGRFIAFEGGEACGKSTQSALLASALDAVLTREPGGTVIGARLRSLVLDPATEGLAPRAEALLMAADRAQHVAEVVEPALAAGRHVVTDRFAGSSIAYQGHGRGLPVDEIDYYVILGRFKLAIVLEAGYARFVQGGADTVPHEVPNHAISVHTDPAGHA